MTLEQFGNMIGNALRKILGNNYEIAFQEVTKNNGVRLHGIVITQKGNNVSPAIYIDELYEEYENGRTLSDIVSDLLCVYRRHARGLKTNMEFFSRYEGVQDRILYKLIHRESNRKLLEEVPYMEWNDLALVFYYMFEEEQYGKASILIKNGHLDMWKKDISTLYASAKENMMRLRPEEMLPIGKVIQEILTQNRGRGINDMDIDLPEGIGMTAGQGPETVMYMLSNRDRFFGAATLLYSESIKSLTHKLNKNLIILPSSVHEVLLVPDDGVTEKAFFREMVKEVNDTQVEPEERLSYNVYYYDRFTGKITIV